jgi:hypothetical protein
MSPGTAMDSVSVRMSVLLESPGHPPVHALGFVDPHSAND